MIFLQQEQQLYYKDTNKDKSTYGEWYKIEVYKDDKWYDLETLVEDPMFNLVGYETDENNEIRFVIDWEWLYGELSPGSYRIIKKARNKYIAIPLNIATLS